MDTASMTDYSKLKVAELKEELKSRNIALTGLKVKQNFIDKLLEADAAKEASNSPAAEAATGQEHAIVPGITVEDEQRAAVAAGKKEPSRRDESVGSQPAQESAQDSQSTLETQTAVRNDEEQEKDVVDEESQAVPAPDAPDSTVKAAQATSAAGDRVSEPPSQMQMTALSAELAGAPSVQPPEQPTSRSSTDRLNTPLLPSAQPSLTSTSSSGEVPSAEVVEDSRKRKRRSATPPPSTIEVAQKKAKASDGSPRVILMDGSIAVEVSQPPKDMEVSTNGHEHRERAIEESSRPEDGPLSASEAKPTGPHQESGRRSRSRSPTARAIPQQEDKHSPQPRQEEELSQLRSPVRSKPRSPILLKRRSPSPPKSVPSEDRHVSPALHPATSSLYIRNFKRPLHIPSLRSHLSALAASPNTDASSDPITSFYLDSIRTHGFVSFVSITAASRVRSALHDSRFPDEKTREPLWVDFVPDEKVEEWIETEQQANGGGRIGRRWEVVYQDAPDGIEAILQEIGSGSAARLAPLRKPSVPVGGRRESEITVQTPTVPGVHPDRAGLVPSEEHVPRRKESTLQQEPRPEQTGTGFRALDDLFPSTIAKPKLYYKLVDAHVAEERLDMIRDLRNLAGAKSGDPDMKRYSFELDRGREEWVDKGPEFGYGMRGRGGERGGRGGYRGRGGMARGGDTWRSGGRY
jgi:SAP domain